ncbi:MAG: peptidyl-prolyl cis-trans isomerase [Candidatus Jordarchaeaceae archaeon]
MKLIFFLTILILLNGCERKSGSYIARVGKKYLEKEELARLLPESGVSPNLTKDDVNSVVNNWIIKEILYQKALEYHFDRDPNIKSRVENYYKDLVIDAFVRYYFQSNINISEEEIQNYYQKNRQSFTRDKEEAKITHVVVQSFPDAMTIKKALINRDQAVLDTFLLKYKFETKIVRRGDAITELDKTIFETPPKNVLGPVATNYGYHIIEIIDRYPTGSLRTLDEVRDEIYQKLFQTKLKENYDLLIKEVMKDADFEIKEESINNFLSRRE